MSELNTTGLTTTLRTTVTQDRIDHLGHMNVRFYAGDARRGGDVLVATLGGGEGLTIAPVDLYTRHHAEQLLGADLEVRSGIVDAVPGSLTLYHELVNADTGVLAATFVHRLVAFGPEGPVSSWPQDPGALPRIEIPAHGQPRTVSLAGMTPEAGSPLTESSSAPSLDALAELDLAIRAPRQVTPEECDAGGTVSIADAPALVWGGDPVHDRDGPLLHDGPDGQVIGLASMETRMRVHRLPSAGTRIQSHGALLEVAEKISHHIMWSHDLDRGDPLISFEVVNLAFDTVSRRAVPIPDAMRADMARRQHPEFAPR